MEKERILPGPGLSAPAAAVGLNQASIVSPFSDVPVTELNISEEIKLSAFPPPLRFKYHLSLWAASWDHWPPDPSQLRLVIKVGGVESPKVVEAPSVHHH